MAKKSTPAVPTPVVRIYQQRDYVRASCSRPPARGFLTGSTISTERREQKGNGGGVKGSLGDRIHSSVRRVQVERAQDNCRMSAPHRPRVVRGSTCPS